MFAFEANVMILAAFKVKDRHAQHVGHPRMTSVNLVSRSSCMDFSAVNTEFSQFLDGPCEMIQDDSRPLKLCFGSCFGHL